MTALYCLIFLLGFTFFENILMTEYNVKGHQQNSNYILFLYKNLFTFSSKYNLKNAPPRKALDHWEDFKFQALSGGFLA